MKKILILVYCLMALGAWGQNKKALDSFEREDKNVITEWDKMLASTFDPVCGPCINDLNGKAWSKGE